MLVMRSERHKYPPHSMVITSASAIDSSNRCLEGLVCACRLMAGWRFRMSFRESGLCWGGTGEGLKPDHSFLAVTRANLLYICNTVDVHYSCMSTWNRKKKKKKICRWVCDRSTPAIMFKAHEDWQGSLESSGLQIDFCSAQIIDHVLAKTVFHSKWLHYEFMPLTQFPRAKLSIAKTQTSLIWKKNNKK